jgi:hypothetical protein
MPKENTIDIAGIGTSSVGMHYDYIFFVDPHSERNVGTKDQIEKVVNYYRLLNSILKANTGRMIIEMTRWHYLDLAYHIINGAEKDQFDMFIKSCYNDDGSLFFPERLNEEFLKQQRDALGNYLFSCNYLSRPQSDSDKIFKPEIATYYDKLPDVQLEKWLMADPSISEKITADDFPVVCIGIDKRYNSLYLLDWKLLDRKQPAQAASEIMVMINANFNLDEAVNIGIETVSFQRMYKYELQRSMTKAGMAGNIVELKPQGRSKMSRIIGLQPFYECGKMLFRKGVNGNVSPDTDIILQLEQYPRGKDDIIDAIAYITDVLIPLSERRDITAQKGISAVVNRIKAKMPQSVYTKRRYGYQNHAR